MEVYKNKSGDAGVKAFEPGPDFIKIQFKDSSKIYTYSYKNPGKEHIEHMKILAREGAGLTTYINRNVKSRFEKVE